MVEVVNGTKMFNSINRVRTCCTIPFTIAVTVLTCSLVINMRESECFFCTSASYRGFQFSPDFDCGHIDCGHISYSIGAIFYRSCLGEYAQK